MGKQINLVHKLQNNPELYSLCLTNAQIKSILQLIANEVEERGDKHLDLDPGETSDWLRQEAAALD
jgi:hypothetical protein